MFLWTLKQVILITSGEGKQNRWLIFTHLCAACNPLVHNAEHIASQLSCKGNRNVLDMPSKTSDCCFPPTYNNQLRNQLINHNNQKFNGFSWPDETVLVLPLR